MHSALLKRGTKMLLMLREMSVTEPRLNVARISVLFALASFIHSQRRSVLTFQTSFPFNENENSRARGVKLHVYHQRSIC